MSQSPRRFVRLAEVLRTTGLPRATLYELIDKRRFPRQVRLGGKAVGWIEGEVQDWLQARISERDNGQAAAAEQGL
jgi:prophage regulatory protein